MKRFKYRDVQIMAILKEAKDGVPVADLYREHGISRASFYKWRSKYGGMEAPFERTRRKPNLAIGSYAGGLNPPLRRLSSSSGLFAAQRH